MDHHDDAQRDQQFTMKDLTEMWVKSAKAKKGKLTDLEMQLIEATAKDKWSEMDIDNDGTVTYEEFVTFSMGEASADGPLRSFRQKLNKELKSNPGKMAMIIERFKRWDKNGDGFVTIAELEEYIQEIADVNEQKKDRFSLAMLNCTCGSPRREDPNNPAPGSLARKLKKDLQLADVDGDGQADIYEVTGWALGRRRTPVELLLYDISKGASRWLSPLLFARRDIEVFHSGVMVFGSEYWYGGKIFRTNPPCLDNFGQPLTSSRSQELKFEPSEMRPDLMVIRMGYTFVTHEEFVVFLRNKLMDRYTGVEKYDLLSHSCNHFADEVFNFLLGHGLPPHILELQEMANKGPLKALRPFLNRWLGGFSGETGGGNFDEEHFSDDHDGVKHDSPEVDPTHILGEGDVVILDDFPGIEDHTPASILKDHGSTVDVRYFCTKTGEFNVRNGLPTKHVKHRVPPSTLAARS